MRLVIALGGNALLRRGEAMTAENQRENVRIACEQIAKVAGGNELVIAHGNGPQVGLLALQTIMLILHATELNIGLALTNLFLIAITAPVLWFRRH